MILAVKIYVLVVFLLIALSLWSYLTMPNSAEGDDQMWPDDDDIER